MVRMPCHSAFRLKIILKVFATPKGRYADRRIEETCVALILSMCRMICAFFRILLVPAIVSLVSLASVLASHLSNELEVKRCSNGRRKRASAAVRSFHKHAQLTCFSVLIKRGHVEWQR